MYISSNQQLHRAIHSRQLPSSNYSDNWDWLSNEATAVQQVQDIRNTLRDSSGSCQYL